MTRDLPYYYEMFQAEAHEARMWALKRISNLALSVQDRFAAIELLRELEARGQWLREAMIEDNQIH